MYYYFYIERENNYQMFILKLMVLKLIKLGYIWKKERCDEYFKLNYIDIKHFFNLNIKTKYFSYICGE